MNQATIRNSAFPPESQPDIAQFSAPIAPVKLSLMYRFALILVAVVMVVLPLVYVAIVGLVGYWLYLHATGHFMPREIRGRAALIMYVGPLLIGIILIFFMIKPLFARRGKEQPPIALRRQEQLKLYTLVDRLCAAIRAPRPSLIQVDCQANASASFRRGFLSFFGNHLVLTIGLPLVAGLNARQFVGVLAHEFGHFTQGGAMRLTHLIRTINLWFYRVVYERDAFDEWLVNNAEEGGGHFAIAIILHLSRLFVWITRRVLWVLMIVGHAVSSFMLRQMEFDADRYEARVSGSDAFEQTARVLPILNVATSISLNELQQTWRERRLCDDLPSLIVSNAASLPDNTVKHLRQVFASKGTGWFDTHPADKDRIASAKREKAKGVFSDESPADSLFDNFYGLCKISTLAFYEDGLGPQYRQAKLLPITHFAKARQEETASSHSFQRYFQGLLIPARPMFLSARPDATDESAAAEALLEARSDLQDRMAKFRAGTRQFSLAYNDLIKVTQARVMRNASFKKLPTEFGFKRADEAELLSAQKRSEYNMSEADRTLGEFRSISERRLLAALGVAMARAPRKADANGVMQENRIDTLIGALGAIAQVYPSIQDLHQYHAAAGILIAQADRCPSRESLAGELIALAKKMARLLQSVQTELNRVPYPFETERKGLSIGGYLCAIVPPEQQIGELFNAAGEALDAVLRVYYRIFSELAQTAEEVETSLGLDPLPDPPDEPEPTEP